MKKEASQAWLAQGFAKAVEAFVLFGQEGCRQWWHGSKKWRFEETMEKDFRQASKTFLQTIE